jgi:HK97 family phage prohead protease
MSKKLHEDFNIKIKSVDEETSTLEAVFSTEDEDRHGDIVRQNWDLKQFKKNPVILNSHNYWSATDVIGKAEKIGIKNGQLEGKIKFAVEENPIAKIIFDLYKNGFLNAFSVGFIPKEFSDKGEILKSELLEISAVSVPANAYALAKSAGIDLKPLFKDITDTLEGEEPEDEEIDDEEEEEAPEEGIEAKKEEEPEAVKPEEGEEETPEEKEQARIDAENAIKEEEEKKKEEETKEEEERQACEIEQQCEAEKQVKEKLDTMLKLVRDTGEILKAETLQEGVRAGVNRLLNKAIREQVRIIKNNK